MGRLQTIDERNKNGDGRCPSGQHWVKGHWQSNPSGLGKHWVDGHCASDADSMKTTRIEKTTTKGWNRGPIYIKEKRVVEEPKDRRK